MCRIFKSFPICIFFVAVSSWEFFLCRSSPWHPGVLNLVSFTWVSHRIGVSPDTKCFHFGAFYVAWGILWPEETFLWQQIRAPLHRETWVTLCTSGTQHWPRQRCVGRRCSSRAKALPNPTNRRCTNPFDFWLKCTSWYKSLAQRGIGFVAKVF